MAEEPGRGVLVAGAVAHYSHVQEQAMTADRTRNFLRSDIMQLLRGGHGSPFTPAGDRSADPHHPRPWEQHPRATAILLAAAALSGDYATGPFIQFPALYIAPVAFTAWYLGLPGAITLAVLLPGMRLGFVLWWEEPGGIGYAVVNALIHSTVLTLLALLTHALARRTHALEREVRVLRGILPICAFCKKIRDDDGSWQPLERVITARSEARFSHGFCEECGRKHYGGLLND